MNRTTRVILIATAMLLAASTAAQALPLIGIAIAFAAGAAGAAALGAGLAISLVVGAAYAGLSYLAQSAMGKGASTGTTTYAKMQTGGVVDQSFIIGTRATPGSLVYFNYWGQDGGTPNAYESRVTGLSDLRSTALLGLIVDDTICTYGVGAPDPNLGYPIPEFDKGGQHYLWVKFYDGSQIAADPFLVSKFHSDPARPYASTRVGRGRTYVVTTIRKNDQNLSSSSTILYVVKGSRWYDPRKDTTAGGDGIHRFNNQATWEYSENPQLIRYGIRRGVYAPGVDGDGNPTSQWMFGLQGMSPARLPFDNWTAAFNDCDTLVSNSEGDDEPAYRCGGEVTVSTAPADLDESLMRACNGRQVEVGGVHLTITGAVGSPIRHYTDKSFLVTSPKKFDPYPGLAGTINGVTARWPDPSQKWQTVDAATLMSDALKAQDGNRQGMADINFDCVPFGDQVQRNMQSSLDEDRRWRTHTVVWPHTEYRNLPSDAFTWTSDENKYDTKLFRIDQLTLLPNRQIAGIVREVDPDDYDPGSYTYKTVPAGRLVPNPVPSQAMVEWEAEGATIYGDGGRTEPGIRLGWATDDIDDVDGVIFEVRRASSEVLVKSGETSHSVQQFNLGSVLIGGGFSASTEYEVRGKYRPTSNRETDWSDWLAVTTPATKILGSDIEDGTIPGEAFAEGISPVGIVDTLPLDNSEYDVVVLEDTGELYRWNATSGAWENEVPAVNITGQLTDDQIAALDAAKITGQIVNAQIAAGAIEAANLAAGITAPGVGTSLPVSGTANPLFFNETDSQLYRWTGSAWTLAVAAASITGTLTDGQLATISAAKITGMLISSQIGAGAVTATQMANATITATQLAAGAVTAAKTNIAAIDSTTGNLTANSVTAATVVAGAIGTTALAASAVTAAKIAAATITATQIAAATILGGNIAASTITGSNIAANTITAANILAGTITAAQIAANTITAGKIAAGAIGAAQIAAGAITASKLFIGDASNMILNTDFSDFSYWDVSAGASVLTGSSVLDLIPATSALIMQSGNGTTAQASSYSQTPHIPIEPGKTYRFGLDIGSLPGYTGQNYMQIFWFDYSDAVISSDFTGGANYTTVAKADYHTDVVDTLIVAPARATSCQMRIWQFWSTTQNNALFSACANPRMQLAADGTLIVDGSIIAIKIAAATITATQIAAGTILGSNIAAGTITASNIQAASITGTQIAANTITSSHLSANSVTAGAIAAGAINASAIIVSNIIVTGHIQAAQITIPSVVTAGSVGLGTSFTTIASVTITTSGEAVEVDFSSYCTWTGSGTAPEVDFQVVRDGSITCAIMTSGGGSSVPLNLNLTGGGLDTAIPVGSHTYVLSGKYIGSAVTAHANSLRLTQLLR